VSNLKPPTQMEYRMSDNARVAITRLSKLSEYTLNHYLDWLSMRIESCREEALRVDVDSTDRLASFSMMIDYEHVYRHACQEAEHRMSLPEEC